MGCVYILKNPAMPDLIKIGYTTRTAEERAKELYDGALGVPKPFVVVHINDCEEPQELETAVHERLVKYRINKSREFFKYPADDAYQVLKVLHKKNQQQHMSRSERIKDALIAGGLIEGAKYLLEKIFQLIRH